MKRKESQDVSGVSLAVEIMIETNERNGIDLKITTVFSGALTLSAAHR
jgi:hypothetical protein